MECLYEIKGVNTIGDRIRLVIQPCEIKKQISTVKALSNITEFMDNMKQEANIINNPDRISIPIDEWKQYKLNIGDIITVRVEVGQ